MFNLNEVELQNDFEVLPSGWYNANIDSMEWKTSKAGAEYLNVKWKLEENNRVVFDVFNLFHPKDQVRNIALAAIKKILIAKGAEKLDFATKEELAEALAYSNVDIKLGVSSTPEYGPQNTIKGYKKSESIKAEDMPF